MCLIYKAESADKGTARLCVNQMPFVYAPIAKPEGSQSTLEGVLGLARGGHNQINYMGLLKSQGTIKDAIVSFNFEDPEDWTQRSQVAFGEVVYSEIEGGEEGVNYYTNLGRQQWGLMIDDFLYDDNDMTNGQKAKIALVDSAGVGISLPEFVWHGILVTM